MSIFKRNKKVKKKRSYKLRIVNLVLLICITFMAIGWSVFNDNLAIENIAASVRPTKEIRITGINLSNNTEGVISSYLDYNTKSIMADFTLPQEDSTITFKVQVTNIGSTEMGIHSINGLDEKLEYSLSGYTLKDKLCLDDAKTQCTLGVQKEFEITIKYKENSYQASNTNFSINLSFDFRSFHKVEYEDFASQISSYPQEVMDKDDYDFTFTENPPKKLKVLMGEEETDFTYKNNQLIVRNITADLKITNIVGLPFAIDDWSTIKENINSDDYNVGDERPIEIEGYGTFTLRLSNKSTPPECEREDFSQTACGFVVEFKDIITTHVMNTSSTNVGGWPKSNMKEYLDTEIYPKLPQDLREVIIKTYSISGHGSGDKGDGPGNNFTSQDKLYLLSPHEVWENGTSNQITRDSAWDYTRQLDYYLKQKITTNNYSPASKKNSSQTANYWWLRGANSNYNIRFYIVRNTGAWSSDYADNIHGVSPAFRIG